MASKQQEKLIKIWKQKGFKVVNIIQTNTNGFPDLMALKDGQTIFIEAKERGDRVKALQKFRMETLTSIGFQCYVNEQKFEDWLNLKK